MTVRYYTSRDTKRPGRRMAFVFYAGRAHVFVSGSTVENAYHEAAALLGIKPRSYEFLYFTHPERAR